MRKIVKLIWYSTPLSQLIYFFDDSYFLSHCVSKEGMEVLTKDEQLNEFYNAKIKNTLQDNGQ